MAKVHSYMIDRIYIDKDPMGYITVKLAYTQMNGGIEVVGDYWLTKDFNIQSLITRLIDIEESPPEDK